MTSEAAPLGKLSVAAASCALTVPRTVSTGDGGYANDWGIGHNVLYGVGRDPTTGWRNRLLMDGRTLLWPEYFSAARLVGVRDHGAGMPWVPCASSMIQIVLPRTAFGDDSVYLERFIAPALPCRTRPERAGST